MVIESVGNVDATVPLVYVGAAHGEPVEVGRQAVARMLDPLLHHTHGDGDRVPHPTVCGGVCAVHRQPKLVAAVSFVRHSAAEALHHLFSEIKKGKHKILHPGSTKIC